VRLNNKSNQNKKKGKRKRTKGGQSLFFGQKEHERGVSLPQPHKPPEREREGRRAATLARTQPAVPSRSHHDTHAEKERERERGIKGK